MDKSQLLLSKSKYMEGLQCPKLLWYEYNRKEEIPSIDPVTQAKFNLGNQIGLLAQRLFPDGIKLERSLSPQQHFEQSLKAVALRKPLFEAGFIFANAYALADILNPVEDNAWDLIEVKSATDVKDEYHHEVAFQKHVYEGVGLKIRRCYVIHINNEYVRQGEIDPSQLFKKVDITEDVKALQPAVVKTVESMLAMIDQQKVPDTKIGPHCDDPYECKLKGICWKYVPDKDSVFVLSRGKKLSFSLLDNNILKITEIPEKTKLTDNQRMQLKVHRTGTPHIDRAALEQFTNIIKYPLYFIDFETIDPAIPLFDLSRPYEKIAFQYSLFIIPKKSDTPQRHAFLWKTTSDPRSELLKQLKSLLGSAGSIIAYNAPFEITAIKNACEAYPEYKEWFKGIKSRFADLYTPFRSFNYYHPDQQGSASIKFVLPALTGKSYKGMDITDGLMASLEYSRVTFTMGISENERHRIYAALEEYCDLDTRGMIDILENLEKL